MASENPSSGGANMSREERKASRESKALKKNQIFDVQELEKRVQIAELRAREVEAEIRYLEATGKRRALISGKRDKAKSKGK